MSSIVLQKNPSFTYGEVDLPSSKSLSNRALIIQALCKQPFAIHLLSDSDDTKNLIDQLSSTNSIKNIGAAGTNMRFLISYLSIVAGEYILTGTDRMQERPVAELVDRLRSLGADITHENKEGYPPLRITGGILKGGKIQIDGSISSQFISSLLMIAPCLEQGLHIEVQGQMVSRPYINMTLELMKYFGVDSKFEGNIISVDPQKYIARDYEVEADWSGAAFWYGLLSNTKPRTQLLLKGLHSKSLQGDSAAINYFGQLGITSFERPDGILIEKTEITIPDLAFNLVNEPDLFPALAFSCAALRVPVQFAGLQTLNLKESKRIEAVKNELEKTGTICETGNDFLKINGYISKPDQIVFDTYHDHRMAMAASIFCLTSDKISINDPEVVSKSYPTYWEDLLQVGIADH